MRPLRAQVNNSELYAKARGDAEGIVGVVVVDVAVGVHLREVIGVVAIRRAEPPISGDAGSGLNPAGGEQRAICSCRSA